MFNNQHLLASTSISSGQNMNVFTLVKFTQYAAQLQKCSEKLCPAGKRHGVWFSNTSVQRFNSSSPPSDSSQHQQVTTSSTTRHQCGLKQQADKPETQPIRNEFAHISAAGSPLLKKINQYLQRLQSINAVNITGVLLCNKTRRTGELDDFSLSTEPLTICQIVLNVCNRLNALFAE